MSDREVDQETKLSYLLFAWQRGNEKAVGLLNY